MLLVTAKSKTPSPFKSATAMLEGCAPTAYVNKRKSKEYPVPSNIADDLIEQEKFLSELKEKWQQSGVSLHLSP
jgi:hypothetical protein